MEVFLTIGLMYGLTFSFKYASLLDHPRTWLVTKSNFVAELLSCLFCTGFHAGWISFLVLYGGGLARDLSFWWALPVYGFVGATVSYATDTLMAHLEGN